MYNTFSHNMFFILVTINTASRDICTSLFRGLRYKFGNFALQSGFGLFEYPFIAMLQNQLLKFNTMIGNFPDYTQIKNKSILLFIQAIVYKQKKAYLLLEEVIPEEKTFISTFDIIVLFYNRWLFESRQDIIKNFFENELRKDFLNCPDTIKCQMMFKHTQQEISVDENKILDENNSTYFNYEYYFQNNNEECNRMQKKQKKSYKFYQKYADKFDSENFENDIFNIFNKKFEISNFWDFICDDSNKNWSDKYDFESEYDQYEAMLQTETKKDTNKKMKSSILPRSKYALTKNMKDQILEEKVKNENEKYILEALTSIQKDKKEEDFKIFVSDCLTEIAKNQNLVDRARQSLNQQKKDKYIIFEKNDNKSSSSKRVHDTWNNNEEDKVYKKRHVSKTFDI